MNPLNDFVLQYTISSKSRGESICFVAVGFVLFETEVAAVELPPPVLNMSSIDNAAVGDLTTPSSLKGILKVGDWARSSD